MQEEDPSPELKELKEAREAKKQVKKLEGKIAMLEQQLELASLSIEELQNNSQKDRLSYEAVIKALEDGNGSAREEEHNKRMQELAKKHAAELALLEGQVERYKAMSGGILEDIKEERDRLSEANVSMRVELEDLQNKLAELTLRKDELHEAL
jgi:hypothetical protein